MDDLAAAAVLAQLPFYGVLRGGAREGLVGIAFALAAAALGGASPLLGAATWLLGFLFITSAARRRAREIAAAARL